jgi:4-carboxymuconolactone decarboxylase
MWQPRIAPLQPPYEPATAALLAKWMPPGAGAEPLRLFRTLAVHDELASRMRPLGAGILAHGRLEPRDREILIHRTCARAGAEYEWGVHALAFGKPVGLSEQQLAATVHGSAEDPAWCEADGELIAAADELYDTDTLSDDLWEKLAARLRADQLLELVILAGWYRLLAYVINVARIEPEPWAASFP